MNRFVLPLLAVGVLSACGPDALSPDAAIECDQCDAWNEPIEPFRIYGNTWYVGTDGLAAILIATDDGLVLLDGGLPQSAARIEASIRALGFDPQAIRVILLSHAHYDHAGGIAALQRFSGARVMAGEAAVAGLQAGALVADDPQSGYGDDGSFPSVAGVEAVADGDVISLGGVEITAVATPGHSPGGTSWTWQSCALDSCYQVVYADSLTSVSAPGFQFSDGAAQQIVDSAGRIAELDCDILLSPHPFFFGMHDKLERLDEGNPFVNNVACMIYAESMLDWLEQRLASER